MSGPCLDTVALRKRLRKRLRHQSLGEYLRVWPRRSLAWEDAELAKVLSLPVAPELLPASTL